VGLVASPLLLLCSGGDVQSPAPYNDDQIYNYSGDIVTFVQSPKAGVGERGAFGRMFIFARQLNDIFKYNFIAKLLSVRPVGFWNKGRASTDSEGKTIRLDFSLAGWAVRLSLP
jgi:hypothetical protein